MVGLEDRELDVGVDARRVQQLLLGADERERLPRRGLAPGGEFRLAERDHVLGQREPLDELAQPVDVTVEPRQAERRARVVGDQRERLPERAPSGGAPPAPPLELPQQGADVGAVLGRRAAGGDGEAHRLDGAGEVAAQLAQVGGAGVGGEVRFAVEHRLQFAGGVVIAAELDERVDADRRTEVPGAPAERERLAEVMARERDLAGGGECLGRARRAEDAFGARVEGGVGGLAGALQVGVGECGPEVVAAAADGALQLRHVGGGAGQHGPLGARRGGGRVVAAGGQDREAGGEGEEGDEEEAAHERDVAALRRGPRDRH